MSGGVTRRTLLGAAAALPLLRFESAAAAGPVALPTPRQVRAEFARMVQFGPRLTASDGHTRYVEWLEREFTSAGLELLPCDEYQTERWLAQSFGLDLLDGPSPGPVKIAAYYTRSQETPPQGVAGPLVYGGAAPALSMSGTDLSALQAAIERYPGDLASWAGGAAGTAAGGPAGSILLVDLPMPVPLTAGAFVGLSTFQYWPGHDDTDWAASDLKRTWIEPGLSVPLQPFQGMGAAGVVFIVDASYEALAGGYLPFTHGFEPIPALFVDRDTGAALRSLAMGRSGVSRSCSSVGNARLRLTRFAIS